MENENSEFSLLNEEELNALKETFYIQAMEMTELLTEEVLALGRLDNKSDSIKKIKRFFHTLKGDSSTIGLKSLAKVIHTMEDLMGGVEDGRVEINDEVQDLILKVIDEITESIKAHRNGIEHSIPTFLQEKVKGLLQNFEKSPLPELSEYEELKAISSAEDGKTIYSVRFYFSPDCLLKSAGALILAQNLPKWCEVVKTEPSFDSPEIEKRDFISAIIASDYGPEELQSIYLIPDVISEVCLDEIKVEDLKSQPIVQSKETMQPAHEVETVQAIRVMSGKIDQVMDLVGELVMGRSMLGQLISRLEASYPKDEIVSNFLTTNAFIGRSLSDLQRNVMSIRMVPVNRVFRKFPRMVRDISRDSGKEMDLFLEGEATEVDKALVDVVGEPLLHLIRNAADHGIESPSEREAAGKNRRGTIRIRAYHKANDIVIKVEDDGRGIDIARLKDKAVGAGIITREDANRMNDREAIELIFLPRFSTAEAVSDVSGRGIGMDIVKEVVESMRGSIEVDTEPGAGTAFTLRFPLTLAIMRAIIFRISDKLFALPMSSVDEIVRVFHKDVDVASGTDMLRNRDRVVPLVRMNDIIGVPSTGRGKNGKMFVLVLSHGTKEIGMVVDSLVREEELVVKAVDEEWIDTDLVCGASILGDGTVVLILNGTAIVTRAAGGANGMMYRKAAN